MPRVQHICGAPPAADGFRNMMATPLCLQLETRPQIHVLSGHVTHCCSTRAGVVELSGIRLRPHSRPVPSLQVALVAQATCGNAVEVPRVRQAANTIQCNYSSSTTIPVTYATAATAQYALSE